MLTSTRELIVGADRYAAVFLAHLDSSRRDEVAALSDLDRRLATMIGEARAAWPKIKLAEPGFLRHVAEILCDRATEPARGVLDSLPAADVYLAAACAAGDATAAAAFREAMVPALRQALAKLRSPAAAIDEAVQRALVMALVGDRGRPQIAGYRGRGKLRSWWLSIGVRTARRLLGAEAAAAGADDVDQLAGAVHDPELAALRARYREPVRRAFGEAVASLAERDRNLLRQYHIDGLTIDQLGKLYRVNRATAARWVVAARSAVLDATRAALVASLGVSQREIDSIIRLVRSQLDLSLRELKAR